MLVLVLLLAGLAPAPVTLDISIHPGTKLDADIVARALEETGRIFEPGGIELRFHLSPDREGSASVVAVTIQRSPARFKVQGCSRGRHDHRLGHAQIGVRRITLYADQVARAVDGDWDRAGPPVVDDGVYARALGRVLAHELGHLLLRLNGHRDRGLMRSTFSHRSLIARGRGAFRLTDDDLAAIRATLKRARWSGT